MMHPFDRGLYLHQTAWHSTGLLCGLRTGRGNLCPLTQAGLLESTIPRGDIQPVHQGARQTWHTSLDAPHDVVLAEWRVSSIG